MSGKMFQQEGSWLVKLGFDIAKVVAAGEGKLTGGVLSTPEPLSFIFDDSPIELLAFSSYQTGTGTVMGKLLSKLDKSSSIEFISSNGSFAFIPM